MRYVNRPTRSLGILIATLMVCGLYAADGDVKPLNDLPQPYQTTTGWAQLPSGLKWGAVIGAAQGPDGNIYVVHRCFNNSCAGRTEPPILVFDMSGKFLRSWGVGMFVFPHGLHLDDQGNVWVADAQGKDGKGHQVLKFSPDGKLLMALGKPGVASDGHDTFNEPTAVVTVANGDIFVTDGHDVGNNRVVKFSKDGTFLKTWGTKGSAPGQFISPHTIAVDSRGRLFVGDRGNNRIQIFDQEGRFLDQWKQFSRPSGIFIAKDDTIYVADADSWGPNHPGWKKGIRIGSAKDGSVKFFIEDLESTTEVSSGPNAVGADAQGHVYGAVNRRQMLERYILKQPGAAR